MEHRNIPRGEFHGVANWSVASTAERDVLTVADADIGKQCWVRGTGHFVLAAVSPLTWEAATVLAQANAVLDFGADNTGATNATTALKNFFDHCIATGTPGHIPAGSYLVTAGVLAFDNGFTDRLWPEITTDGHDAVVFNRSDATDAALIALTNGVATSPAGRYWKGGSLGGITFKQNGKATASAQHGLLLRGVYGTKFGWMRADDMGGSCICLPQALYLGNNPDPYAVSLCVFDGVEANRCKRYALENQNYVGLTGCAIRNLRVIECEMGGWYGLGAGNSCDIVSMGTVKGWAFDDGTFTASTGGSASRCTIGIAELDDVQNGIRLNKTLMFFGAQLRFIARYNFSALNPSEGYWPRIGISIGGGTGPSVGDVSINAVWRIEAGGIKANLGTFTDFHNVSSNNVSIQNRILDNAGFGFVDTDLYANSNVNGAQFVTNSSRVVLDDRIKVAAVVRSSTSDTVPNSGFGTASAKLAFATEIYDKGGYYDNSSYWFTVPYSGLYRVAARICLTMAVGTRCRMAFASDTAGSVATVLNRTDYQVNAGAQHYELHGIVNLTAGGRLFLMADQNTAAPVNLSAPISATADLTWSVEAL